MIPLLLLFAAGKTVIPATKPAERAVTACMAVTRDEVQKALNRRVGQGVAETAPGGSSCDYAADRGRVTVVLERLERTVDASVEAKAMEAEIEGSKSRPARDLGDSAFFLDIAGGGTQLHVVRGRDYLMVSVLGFGEAEQVSAAASQLAKAALTRF